MSTTSWRCSGCNRSHATRPDESVLESFIGHLVDSARCEGGVPLITPAKTTPSKKPPAFRW